ncbi:MAG TPA: chloride channel protein [Candidatus Baltobacteraceae bacterium]
MRLSFPEASYVETERGYRLTIGRVSLSQSTFLLLAAIIVGLGGGFGAVLFRRLISGEGAFAFGWLGPHLAFLGHASVVPVLILGGIITTFVVERFAKEAKGHGVPEVMAAVALRGGIMRPRIIAVKSLASATCIGFGGSVGREGPIVQIGATIGSVIGQIVRAPAPIVRTLVACGAAAGISATFNAPIGGVFFANEVIIGDFAPRSFAVIVVASVVSAVIGRAFFGNHPSFNAAAFYLASPWELVLYAILGLVAAVWAFGFVRFLYILEDGFERWKLHPLLKAAIAFGVVGLIGVWVPQVLGVGYGSMQSVLDGHVPARHALMLAVLKPLATSLTLGGGGSGGVFAPSLYTGAMLGDAFGRIVHDIFPAWTANAAAYGLVGMAAVFAAAAEAPITAIMIVFEMSDDYTIILPLMICTVIATVLGRRLLGHTVYEMKLVRQGIDWMTVRRPRLLTRVSVTVVERQPPIVAHAGETVADVAKRLHGSEEFVVPVSEERKFTGFVTATDIAATLAAGSSSTLVREIARKSAAKLTRADTLEQAATLMADLGTPLLPVVDPSDGTLLGIVTRRDVLDAYRNAADP